MEVCTGDTVSVKYQRSFENGTAIDAGDDVQELTFQAGVGKVLPGFDKAVLGMSEGEKKTVQLSVEEGYGKRDESLMRRVSRAALPAGFTPGKDMVLKLHVHNGGVLPATIIDMTDDDVIVDLNHPLAGQSVIFSIEVLTITK